MRRVTISVKIFSIALGLVLLMACAAAITAVMTRTVGGQLRIVGENYLPAYAALSEAEYYSAEEGLHLRQLFLGRLDTGLMSAAEIEDEVRDVADYAKRLDAALAESRSLINRQIADPLDFDDNIDLARLDTRLELLADDHKAYEEESARLLGYLASGDHAHLIESFARLRDLRDTIDEKLRNARLDMLHLAEGAAAGTRAYQMRAEWTNLLVMLIAGALGIVVAAAVTRGLVSPVRRLLAGTAAVEGGSLDVIVPVTSEDEIGRLTGAFNRMVVELRNKERIRDTFGKYIDPRIVSGLLDRPDLNRAAGERRRMTILFCDMKGFTSLSEGLTPTALVNVINRYLTVMSEPVRTEGGIIDKYIGDAIMAFWGPPFCPDAEQAERACVAALGQVDRLKQLQAELPELLGIKRGLPELNIRIGIATGDVVVGDIGSDVSKSYTVMGDTVNLASRLEGANKNYGSRILVNDTVAELVGGKLELREMDSILVVGKTEPQRVFEVLGTKDAIAPATLAMRDRFVLGLEAYRRRNWDEARACFAQCAVADGPDPPAAVFLKRIEHFTAEPPPPDWDGVWSLSTK